MKTFSGLFVFAQGVPQALQMFRAALNVATLSGRGSQFCDPCACGVPLFSGFSLVAALCALLTVVGNFSPI